MNISVRQALDILWGISTLLVAVVICLLLIVGGVELNPGPPLRDNSSSEDELEVPSCFDFAEHNMESKYTFSAPRLPLHKVTDVIVNMVQRNVLINSLDAESRKECLTLLVTPQFQLLVVKLA